MARHPALPWLLLALGVWGAGLARARLTGRTDTTTRPAWQHSFLELDEDGQRFYRALREGLYDVEDLRASTKSWPTPAALRTAEVPGFEQPWQLAQHGVYVNYLGEAAGLRWLVLYIEPEPAVLAPSAMAALMDEEHHTLPDGTAVHVTVWTEPLSEPRPTDVLAFPVAEGWVQRVGR